MYTMVVLKVPRDRFLKTADTSTDSDKAAAELVVKDLLASVPALNGMVVGLATALDPDRMPDASEITVG